MSRLNRSTPIHSKNSEVRIIKWPLKMLYQPICRHAVNMMDPTTCFIETQTVLSACADLIANQVGLALVTEYPLPSKDMVD